MRHFQGTLTTVDNGLGTYRVANGYFLWYELANLLHQTIDLLEFHFQFFIVWNKWLETPKFFKVEVNWPSFVSFESCSTCHQSSVNFHHHHQSFRAGSEDNQGALLHLTDTDEWVENWAIVATRGGIGSNFSLIFVSSSRRSDLSIRWQINRNFRPCHFVLTTNRRCCTKLKVRHIPKLAYLLDFWIFFIG